MSRHAFIRARLPYAVAAVLLLLPFTAFSSTASADTGPSDSVTLSGTGTLSPGLPGPLPADACIPQSSETFDGIARIVGDDLTTDGEVHYAGGSGSFCESLCHGQGNGNVSGVAAGGISYVRTCDTVLVSGEVLINGEEHTLSNFTCHFTPTNANPTTAFALSCHGLLDS